MRESPATFGFPDLWEQAYREHEEFYELVARSSDVGREIIASTTEDKREAVIALGSLASLNVGSMQDVLILVGNRRGAGAMKLARGMVEVAITALYLERNPAEVGLFLDFPHVSAWNYLVQLDSDNPGCVPADLRAQAETAYNRVKSRFSGSAGKVRRTWSTKHIKEMAEEVDFLQHYNTAFRLGSDLIHAGPTGLISHELDWTLESLVTGHGSMLQAVSSLYNVSHQVPSELGRKLEAQSKEGEEVRKQYFRKRGEVRTGSPSE